MTSKDLLKNDFVSYYGYNQFKYFRCYKKKNLLKRIWDSLPNGGGYILNIDIFPQFDEIRSDLIHCYISNDHLILKGGQYKPKRL